MDHQTFAQLLGNYGEFVGAIGVVITLVYLAVQIRQNTRTMKATALRSMQDVVLLTEHNERYIAALFKLQRDEPISAEERAHLVERLVTIMRTFERIWLEHGLGTISRQQFEQHLDLLRWAMSIPAARRMWSYLKQSFNEDFRALVEAEALSDAAPTGSMVKAFLDLQSMQDTA